MTVTESTAVNVVLTHLLGPLVWIHTAPTDDQVHDALVVLARSANKRLMTGWSERTVAEALEQRR